MWKTFFIVLFILFYNSISIYAKEFKHNGTTFYISDKALENINKTNPNFIKLVLQTESMDDDERQYWFDILPSMTQSQIDRLDHILKTEKRKLEELEVKYQKDIKSLNKKHLHEWEVFQASKKITDTNTTNMILDKDTTYILYKANIFSKIQIVNIKNLTQNSISNNMIVNFQDFQVCNKKYQLVDYINFNIYVMHMIENINRYKKLYSMNTLNTAIHVYFLNLYKKSDLKTFEKYLKILKSHNIKFEDNEKELFEKKIKKYESVLNDLKVYSGDYSNAIMEIEEKINNKEFLYNMDLSILILLDRNTEVVKKFINYISKNPKMMIDEENKESTNRILLKLFIDKYKNDFTIDISILYNTLLSNIEKAEYYSEHHKTLTYTFLHKETYEMYQKYIKLQQSFSQKENSKVEGDLLETGLYLAFKYLNEKQFIRVYQILNEIIFLGKSDCSEIKYYTEHLLLPYLQKQVIVQSSKEYYPKNNATSTSFFELVRKSNSLKQTIQLSYEQFIDKYIKKPKKWAIIIGINNYKKNTGFKALPYAINDSQKMYDTLIKTFGFKKERIKLITNEKATKRYILSSLLNITKQAEKGDDILIFFSGHGDKDDKNAYIIPYDYDKEYAPYSAINIIDEISDKIDTKFRHTLLIFDSCYSGFAKKVIQSKKSKNQDETPNYILNMILNNGFVNILTAGEDEEVFMSQAWKNHSVFTYYLIQGNKLPRPKGYEVLLQFEA